MNDEKKALNERRAALVSHISECRVCMEWFLMGALRPFRPPADGQRRAEILRDHGAHFEAVGMIPSQAAVAETTRVLCESRTELAKKLFVVEALPQAGYASYVRG
jgi:hypothetical protein